jgi:hypothetical protein
VVAIPDWFSEECLTRVWVGIDAGRQSHHAAAVDEHGRVLWSMRVSNDQDALAELLGKVAIMAGSASLGVFAPMAMSFWRRVRVRKELLDLA